jgi:hypothetical protein
LGKKGKEHKTRETITDVLHSLKMICLVSKVTQERFNVEKFALKDACRYDVSQAFRTS